MNIAFTLLGIPTFMALYGALGKVDQPFVALAATVSFIRAAVFLATNRAFAVLDLSNQYATATTDAQRALLAGAGQAMLPVGRSHVAGTFLAFLLAEGSGLLISIVMLRGGVFTRRSPARGL